MERPGVGNRESGRYGASGFPSVVINSYPRLATIGSRPGFQNLSGYAENSEIRTGNVNFSKLYRNHSIRFGADIRYYISNHGSDTSMDLTFTGAYSRGPFDNSPAQPRGAELADWLMGTYGSAVITSPIKPANLATYQGLYVSDDWKVTSRLTLNLGVRYERERPPTERFNQAVAGFAFDQDSPIAAAAKAAYALNPMPEIPASNFQVKGGLLFADVEGSPERPTTAITTTLLRESGLPIKCAATLSFEPGMASSLFPTDKGSTPRTSPLPASP